MVKALYLLAVMSLTMLTSLNPAHAELKLTRKTFTEKQAKKLSKAEAKLERKQAKITCIKTAQNKKDLKNAVEKLKHKTKSNYIGAHINLKPSLYTLMPAIQ